MVSLNHYILALVFLDVMAFLCFPPPLLWLVAGVRLDPYHRVLGVWRILHV